MDRYQVIIEWSDEDNAYIAKMPELSGCMADGPTREAALQALYEAAERWMRIAREEGWQVPQPRKYAA